MRLIRRRRNRFSKSGVGKFVKPQRDLENIDSGHPVAEFLRSLYPSVVVMRPRAREKILDKVFRLYEEKERRSSFEPCEGEGEENELFDLRIARRRKFILASLSVFLIMVLGLTVMLSYPRRGKPPRRILAGTVCIQLGNFQVREPGGKWRNLTQGETVRAGTSLRTGENSFGGLTFPDGSILRLCDQSEAKIISLEDKAVRVRHVKGSTYHRVGPVSSYAVESRDVTAEGCDTAFTFENPNPDNLEILSVFKSVNVKVGEHPPIPVYEGEVMVISLSGGRKAAKIAVSREKLEDPRLCESVRRDAESGYPTGIYEKLDVPVAANNAPGEETAQVISTENGIQLKGVTVGEANSLEWIVSLGFKYDFVALLRNETATPNYPDDEIARYYDSSITSAIDNGVTAGKTYQYRIAAVLGDAPVLTSNTVVIAMPKSQEAPKEAKLELVASVEDGGVLLEWSLNGVSNFWGYVLERTVKTPAKGRESGAGAVQTFTIKSSDILDSYLDSEIQPGCVYVYRVGLMLEGSVILYSRTVGVSVSSTNQSGG